MSEITLVAIAGLLKTELQPINEKLDSLQQTVDSHSTALDGIAKNTSNWQTEITVMRGRMEKYEKAIKVLAEKLNVNVEAILN